MKFLGILAAAMLAVAPAIASADPPGSADKFTPPAPGPVASQNDDEDDDDDEGLIILFVGSGFTIALGAAGLIFLSNDGSDNSAPSTPGT